MKKLLIGLGIVIVVLVVVVIGAAFILPSVVPLEDYKEDISAQVEEATGRKLKIAGDISLSVLPTLEIEVDGVSLENAKGAQTPNMLELKKLQVKLDLLPLISREIVVDRFVLVDPVINLEIDKNGRPNWAMAGAKGKAAPPAGKPKETPSSGADGGAGIGAIKLGDVRLVNGRISFADRQTGETQVVQDINMKVALPDVDSKLVTEGALTWNREKIELALDLDTPKKFLDGKTAKIDAKIKSNPVSLSFGGSLTGGAAMSAGGTVDLNVPSVRKLAAWAGQPLDMPGEGFGPLEIKGDLKMAGPKMSFTNAQLRFDEIKGKGDLRVDTSGVRPSINAKLDIENLNINPYMPPEDDKAATPAPAAAAPAPGQAQAQGWSDEPIDMSGLKAVDADLALNVGGITAKKIKIGKTAVGVLLKSGRLTADLKEMALYDGKGTAQIKVDGAARVPTIEQTFNLSGVQALPLMTDAAGMDRIEGTANAEMKITTRGNSQKAMVSALNGGGKVTFLNGAIRGINLGAMVRNVSSAFLDAKARETQKTDFAELGGTYKITNGILTNNDLLLKSPLLRLNGAGTVDMPKQYVNYRVTPKAVGSIKGQGGDAGAKGIGVPVIIQGPWTKLSYKPDLAGAVTETLKDPEGALKSIKELGKGGKVDTDALKKKLESTNPQDALKSLFGR